MAAVELRPGATVTDVEPMEAGKNAVYAVSYADRETILKVGTASPDRVRAEPAIARFVRDRTAVPVPRVLRASDDVLDRPCCLFERVPGRTVPDRPGPDALSLGTVGRLCEEAGRYLGALHAIGEFENFGPLAPDGDGVGVADPAEDWPSLLSRAMHAKIGELGERFEQHEDALRAYADEAGEECRTAGPFDPVAVHMDYRPANIVFEPGESTVTRAVLDWAGAAAAPAAYEVAHADALLTEWPRLDDREQRRLRTRFRSTYTADGREFELPDVYRVDARLRLMKHLELDVDDDDEVTIEVRADEHRRALETLGALS